MVFEDGPHTRAGSRGTGYRESAGEFLPVRRDSTLDTGTAMTVVGNGPAEGESTIALPPPNLALVFQDPADGEPGRDRMAVHAIWELVLAVSLSGAGYLLARAQPGSLGGVPLRQLALAATVLGLVAAASAIALRAGAPNLSVGAVAIVAAVYLSQHGAGGGFGATAAAIGICAAIGLVQGLIVVGLHVPAWAASLAVAFGLAAWSSQQTVGVLGAGYDPSPHAFYWFAGFCVLSVGASLVGLVPSIRRGFGRFRPVIDPARRRGMVAALVALGATVFSSLLAGLAGLLATWIDGEAVRTNGFELTALALGAALLGGTSAFGRRGGILGTVFAATLISVGVAYAEATDKAWSAAGFAAAAILVGLGVTRLVERYGRPAPPRALGEDGDWSPRVHSLTPAGRHWQQAPTPAGGLWASDDAWGTTSR
jgi:ribose/xylose/arabinose/galactoside ABC-type transport system permease subunit